MIGELKDDLMPRYTLSEWHPLYDSSDMSATQWNKIASEINEKYNGKRVTILLYTCFYYNICITCSDSEINGQKSLFYWKTIKDDFLPFYQLLKAWKSRSSAKTC